MKGQHKIINTLRREPHLAEWWIQQEATAYGRNSGKLRNPTVAHFSKRWTYRELRDIALTTPTLPTLGLIENEARPQPCFCTD
jgi:hypothetical protein